MTDHLAMAREFLDEQLEKRDDIVASYVYGSVARGESNETSDIDIGLIVEGEPDKTAPGVDAWRDGTYIEASLQPKSGFENLEELLEDTYLPNTLYHGLILHDPTGFLTEVQNKLRAVRPDLRDRLCELECSTDLDVDELTDLLALTTQVAFSADLAGKRRYFLNKITWMIENDLTREALHTMWFCFGTLIARQNKEDQSALALGAELSEQWLGKTGWEGEDVLQAKLETTRALMAEMEQLASQ